MKIKNLLIALSVVLLIASCGKSSPEDVARAFSEKMIAQDYDGAKKYADAETGKILDMIKSFGGDKMAGNKDMKDAEVTKVECDEPKDDKTKCECTVKNGDEEKTETYEMKKVDGEWKVHFSKD